MGMESEIASVAGSKTGLIIPYWMVDRRSDGLEQGEGKEGLFSGVGNFPQNREKTCSFTRTASPSETIFQGKVPTPKYH